MSVLLWDASVQDSRMMEVAGVLSPSALRVVFWSSPSHAVVCQETRSCSDLKPPRMEGGRAPALAFEHIPREWLRDCETVHLFVAGPMGCAEWTDLENRQRLVRSLQQLPVPLNLFFFEDGDEDSDKDSDKDKGKDKGKDGDIYALITEHSLSAKVQRVVSHSLSGEKLLLSRACAKKGFVPFGQWQLPIAEAPQALRELQNETFDETLLQRLGNACAVLTEDKPLRLRRDMVAHVAPSHLRWVLEQAVECERVGRALLRPQLRRLVLSDALQRDVRGALGLEQEFMTDILKGRVLLGPAALVTSTVLCGHQAFPRAGLRTRLACFPVLPARLPQHQAARRRWIEIAYSATYDCVREEVVYLALGNAYRVAASPHCSAKLKQAYSDLAACVEQTRSRIRLEARAHDAAEARSARHLGRHLAVRQGVCQGRKGQGQRPDLRCGCGGRHARVPGIRLSLPRDAAGHIERRRLAHARTWLPNGPRVFGTLHGLLLSRLPPTRGSFRGRRCEAKLDLRARIRPSLPLPNRAVAIRHAQPQRQRRQAGDFARTRGRRQNDLCTPRSEHRARSGW